jgi:hypothetical protein
VQASHSMVLTRRPSSIISLYEAKVEDFLNSVKREREDFFIHQTALEETLNTR